MYRQISFAAGLAGWLLLNSVGCSSLGFSLYPAGHFFTKQAEAVIDCSPTQVMLPRELNQTVLAAHYLQPGDVLLVEPVELASDVRFPADQKVLADGTIDLNGFGRVIVAGLTLESAETLIERTIVDSGTKATQVNVRLLEPVHRFYVLGEVASPGAYPLIGHETVLDGILAAGGLTSDSNPCKVVLSRPTPPPSCRVTLPICYREITQLGDTTTNYQLQPGDRIYVASRSFCDELFFWRANQTCDRCCKCQFPCPDPNVANFTNPISSILPAPPALPTFPSSTSTTSPPMSANPELEESSLSNPGSSSDEPDSPGSLELPSIRNLLQQSPSATDPGIPNATERPQLDGELEFDSAAPIRNP